MGRHQALGPHGIKERSKGNSYPQKHIVVPPKGGEGGKCKLHFPPRPSHFYSHYVCGVSLGNTLNLLWPGPYLGGHNLHFSPFQNLDFWYLIDFKLQLPPPKKWAKPEGFAAVPETMTGVGHLKRVCQDAFSVAGAVQETCSSEMLGGQGADFLRGVAFWSIRSSGLLRWICVTGAALCMTWHHFCVAGAALYTDEWKNCKMHWYEAVSSALNLPFLKEASQNCLVFDVVNFENGRKVSQNCLVFDVASTTLHYITQHYATLVALHYNYNCNCNYTTLH